MSESVTHADLGQTLTSWHRHHRDYYNGVEEGSLVLVVPRPREDGRYQAKVTITEVNVMTVLTVLKEPQVTAEGIARLILVNRHQLMSDASCWQVLALPDLSLLTNTESLEKLYARIEARHRRESPWGVEMIVRMGGMTYKHSPD